MRHRNSLVLALIASLAASLPMAAGAASMKMVRFHDLPSGDSRFEQVEVKFPDASSDEEGNTYRLTRAITAQDAMFVELPKGFAQDWHNAPSRQFVLVMAGVLEVETSDREKRQWRAGEVFLADDVRGQGHQTRVLEGPVRLLFVRLPGDFDVTRWSQGAAE
jgi:quercetin dioxygenase-like cupin family protein